MMDHHWAVTTSSGRRVSLLCEELNDYAISYAASSSPTPPPSPDYRRPYTPFRTDSIGSARSSTSSLSSIASQGIYSPETPPSMGLPPLEKLHPVPETALFHGKYAGDLNSPILAPTVAVMPIDEGLSPTSTHTTTVSTPTSPETAAANPAVKRATRRYACQCGKSFTTSGHLARHTRIHTGEKNYVCPDARCAARFSRQDNCMQHFRTHQSGVGTKRAARKRRMSAEAVPTQRVSERVLSVAVSQQPSPLSLSTAMSPSPPVHQQNHSYEAPQNYISPNYFETSGSDGGLTALANIACSGYS